MEAGVLLARLVNNEPLYLPSQNRMAIKQPHHVHSKHFTSTCLIRSGARIFKNQTGELIEYWLAGYWSGRLADLFAQCFVSANRNQLGLICQLIQLPLISQPILSNGRLTTCRPKSNQLAVSAAVNRLISWSF